MQPIYKMANEAVKEVVNILNAGKRFKGIRYFKARIEERSSVAPLNKK
jgi:hypothetical protein